MVTDVEEGGGGGRGLAVVGVGARTLCKDPRTLFRRAAHAAAGLDDPCTFEP